jgi:eukaryotic-like serine/threonine-protein kinase
MIPRMSGAELAHEETESGKYRVLLELGQGGTANVFLALAQGPSGFNKLVVLKSLRRQLASDPALVRMFLDEARLSARLNHKNIVQVYEIVEEGGNPTIVMEYIDGRSLSEIVARSPEISLALHGRVISEALTGLHYSHELTDFDGTSLNVVHRDMTPENVMVTYDGEVKVLDFGIAKVGVVPGDTDVGVIKGKLRYIPPEQFLGEAIDRRADIYAIGAMLWEAAVGQRIWKDLGEPAIMNRVVNGQIPAPRDVRPDVPEELDRICRRAMACDAADRYPTAAAMQADLDAFLSTLAPVRDKDLAGFVAAHFADERTATKRLIEEKARAEGSISLADAAKISFASSFTGSRTSRAARLRARRSRLVAALVALGLAVTALLYVALRPRPAPIPPPAPVIVAPPVIDAAPPAPRRVRVHVTVFPESATVYVDGAKVGVNPWSEERLADGSAHKVRAEATGFLPEERAYTAAVDQDVVIELKPDPKAAPAVVKGQGKTPKPRRDAGPAPANPCAVPYYFDERGIKKFKPECL